ncbi:TPA: hypothetical protein ACH3X3_006138 [Trebouxia sp. C0006]
MRDAFAGVRDSAHEREDSDLSCCVYGQSCTLFCDSDLAASLDTGRHLQAWLGDSTILVDRYDVRLLLHDGAQISKALHRRDLRGQEADTTQEDLEFERYRDLNPERSTKSASSDDEQDNTGPEPEPEVESSAAYAAVPFVYSNSEAHEQPEPGQALPQSRPAAPAVPDIAFTPTFAVPASVQKHLPKTERMHKDMLVIDAAPSAAADSKSEGSSVVLLADHASLQEASSVGQPAPAPVALSQPEQGMQQDAGAPQGTASSHSQALDTAFAEGSMSAAADSTAPAQPAALPPVADMQALARRIGMTSRPTPQPVSQSAGHAAGSALVKPQQLVMAQSHPQAHAVVPSTFIPPAVSDPAAVPAEIQAIIRKLVLFIKKAGPKFEATVRTKEKANPRFAFLLPWNQYHQYYRQQLVDVLGQAIADEVIALRGHMSPEASASQPAAAPASPAGTAAAINATVPSQAAQAAAEDLHNQAAAAIPHDSSLAQTLTSAETDQGSAATAGTTTDIPAADEQSVPAAEAEMAAAQADSADAVDLKAAGRMVDADDGGHVSNDACPIAAPQASVRSKLASSGVTVVRSNPRFASKPPREESDAVQSGDAQETAGAAKGNDAAVQSSADQSIEQEAVTQPAEQHAAHAAALSLEAVIEAQSVLLQERQQQHQPNMTQEEKKAHRRRLMRQMLDAKQKSEEDAEEQRRKEQQSALAKYRQAFASDAEEEVIHMKLEDDEEYEAPEPGEIVDEPEGKPVSGPVLSAPPPSPLPSLEALIRPRQDLVPQQRTFPLPFSAAGKPASQSNDRGAKPSTATSSDDNDSQHTEGRSRKGRHKHKRARRRSRSSSSDSRASSSRSKGRKHKRRSRHSSRSRKSNERKHSSRHKRRRQSRSSSRGRNSSQSLAKRSRHRGSDNAEDMLDDSADALRAKVRAMLGHL